ncbi:MAG: FAD-dependent oxidoreductase [Acidobacteriota bacterium]|nr:FAD-dependent oxidoreductase [Acidobacteriota bacterium]MDE2962548.1 FAD-dependent oxidoreductase [Acidobacteriota bacterium]
MITRKRFPLGSRERPLQVAIVGSGPSGFYTADTLLKQKDLHLNVDMFERMAMPYGLVRYGVAPDHQKTKQVIRIYEATAGDPRFRFFGNVQVGRDLQVKELQEHYDQIVYAVGCESDRRLSIPGEDLPGSHTATAFVAWYNGHPDHRDDLFDLSARRVAVVGVGNVAMDVTRILAQDPEGLASTDIAEHALQALRRSSVEEVVVLGRRGPVQAKFTPKEIREIGDLSGVDLTVRPQDLELDPLARSQLEKGGFARRNFEYLKGQVCRGDRRGRRRVRLRFFTSPVEIQAKQDRVGSVRMERNRLVWDEQGHSRCVGTGVFESFEVGLVFRSVGYRGIPIPDVPFDERKGLIPNAAGRVLRPPGGEAGTTEYVVGWIKRGPSGLIGANKRDSAETVREMMKDIQGRAVRSLPEGNHGVPERLLRERGVRPVHFRDWQRIDAEEQERGRKRGKVREKITDPQEVVALLKTGQCRKAGKSPG